MKSLNLNLNKQKKYLVAVSYGPDSMALLSSMVEQGFNVEVAHVNYKKRKESDQEAKDLKRYCDNFTLPCHVKEVSTPLLGNFQKAARDFRYDFFKTLLTSRKLDVLLTAHHMDDHLETAYFQLDRHSTHLYYGIQALSSIGEFPLIRPLLNYRKSELLTYCQVNKVPYANDVSNQSTMYTRNKHRQTLAKLSALEWQTFKKDIETRNNLNKGAQIKIEPMLSKRKLMISTHQSFDQLEKFSYWAMLFKKLDINKEVSQSFLDRLESFAQSTKPNLTLKLSNQSNLYKSYDHFIVIFNTELASYMREVKSPEMIQIHLLKFDFHQPFKLFFPFIVRSGVEDDVYLTAGSKKKLRRLWIDWKMPIYLRKIWPVFTNLQQEVIYVPRYRDLVDKRSKPWLHLIE
jgi:tRNA(Ile)-lysidine synthetase-like protein